jgi:hypothetical protein
MRILAIGILDIVLTLPFGILTVVARVKGRKSLPFYPGWSVVHSYWEPFSVTYDELLELGFWDVFQTYLNNWIVAILSIVIFALFGFTKEARATYWRGVCVIGKLIGSRSLAHMADSSAPQTGGMSIGEPQTLSIEITCVIFALKTLLFVLKRGGFCNRSWPRGRAFGIDHDAEQG